MKFKNLNPLPKHIFNPKTERKFQVNQKASNPCIPRSLRLFSVTSQERFELPTDGLEGRCSILLSYWDMILFCFALTISDKIYYMRIGT